MESAGKVLVYWDTLYGEIKLVKDREGKVALFIDDALQFHEDSEERYHQALFSIPAHLVGGDLRVLVLGGGDGLGVRNLLRFPFVKEVLLVDISPEMVALATTDSNLLRLNRGALKDEKVKVVIGDAYEKVRELKLNGEKFDLIILDYPDVPPVHSHQIARLYTEGHFRDVKALLSEKGVVSIQAGSFSVLPVYTEFVLKTARKVFGRGFTARVVLKGFPDGAFYYSSDSLVRALPEDCFVSSLKEIKAFLYRDEENIIKRLLPYVKNPTEAVIADFRNF